MHTETDQPKVYCNEELKQDVRDLITQMISRDPDLVEIGTLYGNDKDLAVHVAARTPELTVMHIHRRGERPSSACRLPTAQRKKRPKEYWRRING